jgi:hypothetical protein
MFGTGSEATPTGRWSVRDALAACAAASEWDARKAMQWWQGIES